MTNLTFRDDYKTYEDGVWSILNCDVVDDWANGTFRYTCTFDEMVEMLINMEKSSDIDIVIDEEGGSCDVGYLEICECLSFIRATPGVNDKYHVDFEGSMYSVHFRRLKIQL